MTRFFTALAALSLSLVSVSAATVDFRGPAHPAAPLASVDAALRA